MKVCLFIVAVLVSCSLVAAVSDSDGAAFAQSINDRRSDVRKYFGLTPPKDALPQVSWSAELAAKATALGCSKDFTEENNNAVLGESLITISTSGYRTTPPDSNILAAAIKNWSEKQANYFQFVYTRTVTNGVESVEWSSECSSYCADFQQLISSATKSIGCAVVPGCTAGQSSRYWVRCLWSDFAQFDGSAPYIPADNAVPTDAPTSTPTSIPTLPPRPTPTPDPTVPTAAPVPPTPAPTAKPNKDGYYTIDYRNDSRINPVVKNQGSCGSCWAFSSTFLIEWAVAAFDKRWTNKVLSEQDTIDCTQSNGCNGGWPISAMQNLVRGSQKGGLVSAGERPYVNQNGPFDRNTGVQSCPYSSPGTPYTGIITTAQQVRSDKASLFKALATYGPIGVAMSASDGGAFQSYRGGVYTNPNMKIDHAVTVVGYDANLDAWIVRNSWGTRWGVNGYFYLSTDERQNAGIHQNGGWYAVKSA